MGCYFREQLPQLRPLPCSLLPTVLLQAQKRYPLVTGGGSDGSPEQETKRVHVFGKQWALQPEDYEAVMFKNPFLSGAVKGLRQKLPGWLGGTSG